MPQWTKDGSRVVPGFPLETNASLGPQCARARTGGPAPWPSPEFLTLPARRAPRHLCSFLLGSAVAVARRGLQESLLQMRGAAPLLPAPVRPGTWASSWPDSDREFRRKGWPGGCFLFPEYIPEPQPRTEPPGPAAGAEQRRGQERQKQQRREEAKGQPAGTPGHGASGPDGAAARPEFFGLRGETALPGPRPAQRELTQRGGSGQRRAGAHRVPALLAAGASPARPAPAGEPRAVCTWSW